MVCDVLAVLISHQVHSCLNCDSSCCCICTCALGGPGLLLAASMCPARSWASSYLRLNDVLLGPSYTGALAPFSSVMAKECLTAVTKRGLDWLLPASLSLLLLTATIGSQPYPCRPLYFGRFGCLVIDDRDGRGLVRVTGRVSPRSTCTRIVATLWG